MDMVDWQVIGIEVVVGRHGRAKSGGVGCLSGDAGTLLECEVMTPDYTAFQVRSSG